MNQNFSIIENNSRRWILHEKKPVAAITTTGIRTYLYPFFTPGGTIMLQESPADHAHHQGIFVGQDFVNGHNFWAMNHPGYPLNTQMVEDFKSQTDDTGITIIQKIRWVTLHGQHMLIEERVTRLEVWDGFHFAEIATTLTATYGDLYISQTKEGGIAMRVHPQLETIWGGTIRSTKGVTAEKGVFDTLADWIEISGPIAGQEVGVVMMPHPSQPQIPWFTRDYGLHNYSPRRHAPLKIPAGDRTSLRVGFAVYDGKSDNSQASRAWEQYKKRV